MKCSFLRRFFALCAGLTMAFLTIPCQAQELNSKILYSFESDADIGKWSASGGSVKRSSDYATEGASSAFVETPKWHHGMSEWPIWQITPEVNDWSNYDRILIDFINPTPYAELVRFKAADEAYSKVGSADWPAASYTIQPRSHLRIILPFKTWFGSQFDLKNVRSFLLYTARAPENYQLHIDNITLLASEQTPMPPSPDFRQQIYDLRMKQWSLPKAKAALSVVKHDIDILGIIPANADIIAWSEKAHAALQVALQSVQDKGKSEEISTDNISILGDEADTIGMHARRLSSLIQLRSKAKAVFGRLPYAVSWADSMQKILPLDMPVIADINKRKILHVARNESESIQLVVIPFAQDLKNCRIEFSKFKKSNGEFLPENSLDARVVGYVKTQQPAYEVDYVGWWPDPLLDFLPHVDIEKETAQSFWLRVRMPKNQAAGTYQGEVKVLAEGVPSTTLKLTIKVHNFEMPDRAPLPLSNQISGAEFFNKYSSEDWETQKFKVTDFLSDYYINFDNMYRHGPPDFEILKHLRDQGRLSAFALNTLDHTIFTAGMDEESYHKAFQKLISEIQAGYKQAKEENILKYAYIYGMDEIPTGSFPILKRLTSDLKAKFPDLPIATTAQDFSYGENSGAHDVDIWVPIIHEYTLDKVQKARTKGKKVWWYTCQSPSHPYPNIFTEYPSLDIRLLMGFMSAKLKPDGFLYYSLFRDQGAPRKAITKGPFTDWDARAFIEPFNGEGYLAYPGSDGRSPMASIRLENFRDGLEDYAYWKILEATADKVRKASPNTLSRRQQGWLQRADKILQVPDSIVKNAALYTSHPGDIYNYRIQIAELIDQAGVTPATPQWPNVK